MNKKILNEELQQMKYLFGYKPGKVISEQKGLLKENPATQPPPKTQPVKPGTKPQGPGEVIVNVNFENGSEKKVIKFPFIKNQETFDKYGVVSRTKASELFYGSDTQKRYREARAAYQQRYNEALKNNPDPTAAARAAQSVYDEMMSGGEKEADVLKYLLANIASQGVKIEDFFTKIGKDQMVKIFNRVAPINNGWENYFIVDAYGQDLWEKFKEKVIPFVRERIKEVGGNPDNPMQVTAQTTSQPTA